MTIPKFLASPLAAITAVFAAFGAIAGAFSGSVPQMMASAKLTDTSYGLAITLMMATTVASMAIAGSPAARFSHRALLLILLPLAWVIYAGMLMAQSSLFVFIAAALAGAMLGALM